MGRKATHFLCAILMIINVHPVDHSDQPGAGKSVSNSQKWFPSRLIYPPLNHLAS